MLLSQHVETRTSVIPVTPGGFGYLLRDRVPDLDEFLAALVRWRTAGATSIPRWSAGC